MDTTASSFTLRKNAKRAAEAMIRKGTAPAVDYGIKLAAGRAPSGGDPRRRGSCALIAHRSFVGRAFHHLHVLGDHQMRAAAPAERRAAGAVWRRSPRARDR